MTQPPSTAGLCLPHTDPNLTRILSVGLEAQLGKNWKIFPAQPSLYWSADYFELDQVGHFQACSEPDKLAILQAANQSLIQESCLIEQAGIGYMSKMVLSSETLEERMLYGLFCTDEVTHLAQLQPFLARSEEEFSTDPFLTLLSEVVESADKIMLLLIIQVVLEGWGLTHYRSLAKNCQDPRLKQLLDSFLQAESRHHATGVSLVKKAEISASSRLEIVRILKQFLALIQMGPQRLLAIIEKIIGHLTRPQKILILQDLNTEAHSRIRLELLRSLIQKAGLPSLIETLDQQGFFRPLAAEHCV